MTEAVRPPVPAPAVAPPPPAAQTPAEADVHARLVLVALIVGWGCTWPAMKIALDEIPVFSMRLMSLAFGIAALVLVGLLSGRRLWVNNRRAWPHVLMSALFNIVAFNIFTPFAQMTAATSRVAIVVYTMPIWAALFAWLVLGERLNAVRALALLLCILGMGVLIYPLTAAGTPIGILLALGTAMNWAAGTVYLKWARPDADPIALTVWQLVVGLICLAILVPVVEGSLQVAQASTTAWIALVFSGVIGSGVAFFLWFTIVRRVPAMTAALGVLSVPAVGVVSSMILLGERPTVTDLIGFALIFAASACVLLWPEGFRRAPAKN
jgi:drug/metabolite transporter (DMT)-like permease